MSKLTRNEEDLYTYTAVVKRIIDGDSVEVDIDLGFHLWIRNRSLRLRDIDAPETRSRDPEMKAAGIVSKEVLEDLLPIGEEFIIQTVLDGDKYGRISAYIFSEGVEEEQPGLSVNDYLVKYNYAVRYDGKSKEELILEHQKNWVLLRERGEL